jgi:AcrR family transcriptional regulator
VRRTRRAARAYHHGDLRRALVEAATTLLDRHGPLDVTLRGAARAAGVSQAAPYRHFASKEALLAAVAEEAFQALNAACTAAASADGIRDSVGRLEAIATAYVRFAVDHPARYRLMWSPSPRGRDYPALGTAVRATGEALLGALSTWDDAADDSGERRVVRMFVLWSLLHGVTGLIIDEQLPLEVRTRVPVEDIVQAAMQVLREGLLPRSPQRRRSTVGAPRATKPRKRSQ